MTTMYAITATVNGRQVPTFYLHPDVQGIISASHAVRIAKDVLNTLQLPGVEVEAFALLTTFGDDEE